MHIVKHRMKRSPSKTNASLAMYALRLRALTLLACLGLATATPLLAQTPARHPEAGRPFITNFTPADYDAESQNWAVIEDERGVVYAGNNSGVLEYDGVAWRLLPLPNRTGVRSLARDADGRIWVGSQGDLGYLAPDSLGRMVFVSLRDALPEAHRDIADVWSTHATDEGVYFRTDGAIFRWDGQAMQVWPSETPFHVASVVDGVFYVRQWDVGLLRMEHTAAGDSLRLVPGGERFAGTRIYVMLPFGDGRLLVGTREEGLFLYDGARFEPFKTEADGLLAEGQLYLPGAVLPGGRFALGTLTEGLVVIDRTGRLTGHLDGEAGLQNNTVYYPYEDRSGNLWLALDKGLSRVEIGSPFTRYDTRAGVTSAVSWITRHEGRLYAATASTGIVHLDPSTRTFRPVESPLTQTFSVLSVAGDLLVAGSIEGAYRVVRDRAEPVRWSRDPNRVLVGLTDGLGVLRKSATGWIDEGRIPGVDVWYLAEAADGTLWVGTQSSRLARVRLPEPNGDDLDLEAAEVTLYGPQDGLTEGSLYPFRVGNEVYISGLGERVFRFEEAAGRFTEDHTFDGARSGHPLAVFTLREDAQGRVWIASIYGPPVVADPQKGGSYTFETLRHLRRDRILDTYPEADGIVWLMGENQLIRYDTKLEVTPGGTFPPLIRQVSLGDDDLRYSGAGEAAAAELAHGTEAVHFAYATPGIAAARFRTRLEGFDADWSAWTTETERAYTNLPPGDYTFRVEAEARGEAAYAFTVLPPWYRTWWAYGLYAVLFALGVFAVDHVQRRRLVKKERERSALREAELRAEAAESQAQAAEATAKAVAAEAQVLKAENERKHNVELLSQIGQAITSTLSITEIIETVYEHVNALMDASIFGVGIYNEPKARIDFPATKEKGVMLPPYSNHLDDENRLPEAQRHGRQAQYNRRGTPDDAAATHPAREAGVAGAAYRRHRARDQEPVELRQQLRRGQRRTRPRTVRRPRSRRRGSDAGSLERPVEQCPADRQARQTRRPDRQEHDGARPGRLRRSLRGGPQQAHRGVCDAGLSGQTLTTSRVAGGPCKDLRRGRGRCGDGAAGDGAGALESGGQCPRRGAGAGRQDGQRLPPESHRGDAQEQWIRGDTCRGQRSGDPGANQGADFRAVFHDEADGQRDGSGFEPLVRHHHAGSRGHVDGGEQGGRGRDVHRHVAGLSQNQVERNSA